MKLSLSQIAFLLTISLFLTSVSATLADVDEHIVLWLRFDEGEGNVAKDFSNYGNDGEIVGPEWVKGKYGSALLFRYPGYDRAYSPAAHGPFSMIIRSWPAVSSVLNHAASVSPSSPN